MDVKTTEELRASYRPNMIRVLFVGESAPMGGTFFYEANSNLYRGMMEILAPTVGTAPSFLASFKRAGCYLDDLVLHPINTHSQAERKRQHLENVPALAERLVSYRPGTIVSVLKAIQHPVEEAARLASLTCPVHAVSFPGNRRQADFRREMTALLPQLGLNRP